MKKSKLKIENLKFKISPKISFQLSTIKRKISAIFLFALQFI